ncbi:hypothetical protein NVP1236O_67 [Vibrio phage 1.236.O._10N.261.52.C4]|nr:hypothetical protein NVP1236O_67 [Vibrio phage 1.236.O._10N.261.52.C4]
MLKWGNEETQKEGEFFEDNQMKEYSLVCLTGDFNLSLGYAMSFNWLAGDSDPIFLETARGDFRTFKTVDAAINLCKSKDVGGINVFFDPR